MDSETVSIPFALCCDQPARHGPYQNRSFMPVIAIQDVSDVFYVFGRGSGVKRIGRDVGHDKAAGGDDGVFSDGDRSDDGDVGGQPRPGFDADVASFGRDGLHAVQTPLMRIVGARQKRDVMVEHNVLSDVNVPGLRIEQRIGQGGGLMDGDLARIAEDGRSVQAFLQYVPGQSLQSVGAELRDVG